MAIYPRFRRGQRLSDLRASEMSHLVNRVKRLDNIHGGEGLQVSDTSGGVRITMDQIESGIDVVIQRFAIIRVRPDYLECRASFDSSFQSTCSNTRQTRAFKVTLRGKPMKSTRSSTLSGGSVKSKWSTRTQPTILYPILSG